MCVCVCELSVEARLREGLHSQQSVYSADISVYTHTHTHMNYLAKRDYEKACILRSQFVVLLYHYVCVSVCVCVCVCVCMNYLSKRDSAKACILKSQFTEPLCMKYARALTYEPYA